MPKLLLFAPCEKAIVEEGSNTLSLITVLQEVNVSVHSGAAIQADALAPHRWYLAALWRRESGDEGRRFEQRITIADPNQVVRLETFAEFDLPKPWHRAIVQIEGLPIAVSGEYTIAVAIREGKRAWSTAAEFPMTITHVEALDPQLR